MEISAHTDRRKRSILRKYYLENDYFTSYEGVFRGLAVVSCTLSCLLFVWGGGCTVTVSRLVVVLTLGAGACLSLVYAVNVLALAAYAPMIWFLFDLIVSTILGTLLLLLAILGMVFCNPENVTAYLHGPLSLLNGGLVLASALTTYMAVTSRWDAASEPPTSQVQQANELEV